jgi:Tol biopolymer transport system component
MINNTNELREQPLESWKEIAVYLKRDVRTVIRWEKREGLPVHRQMHQARGSVFAYPTELEAWKNSRDLRLNAPPVITGWRRATSGFAIVAAMLLALVTMGSGPIRTPSAAAAEQAGRIVTRQVWVSLGNESLYALTPDGRYLTFQDWESKGLAIRDLATGQKRQLTDTDPRSGGYPMASLPSPDGKEVAYCWHNFPKDNSYDLRIVGLDGSKPRVLYANPDLSYVNPTDWSPDGKDILAVFSREDKSNQMVLVSATDGSVRVLRTFNRDLPGRARFSRDGRHIAYDLPQGEGSDDHDIFLLTMPEGRETPVVRHPANDVLFDWTPDGKRILFGSDRTGTMGAWWIQIADGKPKGTPELVKPDLGLHVWPMGFTQNGSYYYSVETQMSDVYIAELDLATGRLLAPPRPATQRFVGSNSGPDWSSDGRQLVYRSRRGWGWGASAICLRDTESGEVHELASKFDQLRAARWCPDSRSLIAGTRLPSGGFGLVRIDVQTGEFERVGAVTRPWGWAGTCSPNGRAFYYHRWNKTAKTPSIVSRDLVTGEEKVLHSVARPTTYCAGVALSRDGQQLAFAVREAENGSIVIKVMPAAGGEARDLLGDAQMPFPGSVAWTPDGRGVLFVKQPKPDDSKTELWLIPVKGGEPRKLDLTAENMGELCVHPDGHHIAFTAGQDKQEVWAMESFLPTTVASK